MDKQIKKAEKFAESAHKGQTQENGKPYVEHPRNVASLLKSWKQDEEVIIAGLLHDVVEDCGISLKEIKNKFGERVSLLVDGMSWKRDKEINIKDKKVTYTRFAEVAKTNPALVLIKFADLEDNSSHNLVPSNEKFMTKKGIPRNREFFIPFLREGGMKKEMKKIDDRFNKFSKEKPKIVLFNFISKEDLNKIKEEVQNLLINYTQKEN